MTSTAARIGIVAGVAAGLAALVAWQGPAKPDPAYVAWLEERSMLAQARRQAEPISGSRIQWKHPYGEPQPREVVKTASVWLLDYPGAVIPRPGESVIATWANADRWRALRSLGVQLLHHGPVKRAGGLSGKEYTPTIDGWFDPVSLEIDPGLGTADEYRNLAKVAAEHGAILASGSVPLHTGFGPDFRLATLAYKDYPGLYTMVTINKEDWPLLPAVEKPDGAVAVPIDAAKKLTEKGYLPGLINSNDADPEARSWSGWSATGEVVGVDNEARRWVFLHYFKPAQPTLNWLDPSFAAQRVVVGDLTQSIHHLGAKVVRLDAVPFLGLEIDPGAEKTLHYQHPLSVNGTDLLAMSARKLGGWTFHELNVPLKDLANFTRHGPDLSYDFVTRAQCLHALLTADAGPLRLAYRHLREADAQPLRFVHDLQNHDEITYQLTELGGRKGETFDVGGKRVTGKALRERMLAEMREKAAGDAAPYNRLYRPEKDGLATTFAGFVAPAVGVKDPYRATPAERDRIRDGHFLLAAANALQPGVFSLSTWDLVGALPVPEESVADHVKGGDYRWINRGGVDLMGVAPDAKKSAFGLPRAVALYGSLPEQLADPASFASRLKRLLAARKQYRIAEGELVAAPDPRSPAVCLLVLKLPEHPVAVTALNFGPEEVEEELDLAAIKELALGEVRGGKAIDVVTGEAAGAWTEAGRLKLRLPGRTGRTALLTPGPK